MHPIKINASTAINEMNCFDLTLKMNGCGNIVTNGPKTDIYNILIVEICSHLPLSVSV